MAGQQPDHLARGGSHLIFRAIARKHRAAGPSFVHMAAHKADLMPGRGQQPDIDAAPVIAVDQHDVAKGRAARRHQHIATELAQRDAVLGLDHHLDFGGQIAQHLGSVADGDGVHLFLAQLDPADPVAAPVCHHLDRAILAPGDQRAPVAAQQDIGPLVGFLQPQIVHQCQDARLVGIGIDRLLQQIGQRLEGLKHRATLGPVGQVHDLGPLEQVLDIEGGDAHGGPRGCGSGQG
jgi:hypothetical protein